MRITARGTGLLIGAAGLLLAGFGFGYAELALLGTTAVIALACALGYAVWRPRLEVTRLASPDRVSRGEPATMTLTIRNDTRLRSANLIAEDRCGDRPVAVPLLRLRPGRDTTVSYPVPTQRRGIIPIGPLRVTGGDALGLIAVARSYGEPTRVWVHPRVHPLTAVPAGATRSLDGHLDRLPQGSVTFDSLREYVVGDELRRVHWRSSAKVGELMVREQLDTSQPRLVVLLDNRVGAHPQVTDGVAETFESACEAAASVVAAARREGLPVALLLVADPDTDDGPGPDSGSFLDRLATATLQIGPYGSDDDPLRTTAGRLRQERLGDTLVFLTGPGARDDLGYLGTLRGAFPAVVAGIFGTDGETSPGASGMMVIEAPDGAGFAAQWDGVRRW